MRPQCISSQQHNASSGIKATNAIQNEQSDVNMHSDSLSRQFAVDRESTTAAKEERLKHPIANDT